MICPGPQIAILRPKKKVSYELEKEERKLDQNSVDGRQLNPEHPPEPKVAIPPEPKR